MVRWARPVGETIIIRERPAATRGALRVPAPSLSAAPWLDTLRRTLPARTTLVWGLTLAGASLTDCPPDQAPER
jgi:hypothetical protein